MGPKHKKGTFETSVVDLDSLNPDPDMDPDPAFQVNPDPIWIQGFDDQNLKKKKYSLNFFYIFFRSMEFDYP
jgi:hypothetical protein